MTENHQQRSPVVRLSKSRYQAGLQCKKLLWWQVHERASADGSAASGPLIERGNRVGEAAREFVPGGVLIDLPPYDVPGRVAATAEALAAGARVIYEASFLADGVFVSVDILERKRVGFALVEVKATLDVKDHHINDVALQLHVLRGAGLPVKRVELMHLNRDCRHPDLSNLFVRRNVTRAAHQIARAVPRNVRALAASLQGQLPDVSPGDHCTQPYACAFQDRCWPTLPKHHVSTLYRISAKKRDKLIKSGCETLHDLPADFEAAGVARRQIDSVRRRRMVVEPGLAEALEALDGPIAFLDFETILPAIPVWPGCRPFEQVPVQFSCHVLSKKGLVHHAWLADGADDPRKAFARALLDACEGAHTILAYNAPFEQRCIKSLSKAVPRVSAGLLRLNDRVQDLLPIVRDHIYHPAFNGSFSIKDVLPALVAGSGYSDLKIQDGGTAASALEAMLLGSAMAPVEKLALRENLLAYCERDTVAMVRLFERLQELAAC